MTDKPLFFATLPYGPSMNMYWRSRVIVPKDYPKRKAFANTYVSEEGIAFQMSVKAIVHAKAFGLKLTGRLAINLLINPPDKRARDLDNLLKPILDALMYAGFPVMSEKRDGKAYYRFLDQFQLGQVPFTPDELLDDLTRHGVADRIGLDRIYPTLPTAVAAYLEWEAANPAT